MGRLHLSPDVLSALADGELEPDELRVAREHLFECASCSSAIDALRAFDVDLRQAPSVSCEAALPLISAELDGELDQAEAAVARRHLETCSSCSALRSTWAPIPTALALLPAGSPSPSVDQVIAGLTRGSARPGLRPILGRGLVAVTAALALLVAGLSRGAAPLATVVPPNVDRVLVASAQQIVLNPRTNTLYVLDTTAAAVDARDASTNDLKTRIDVGGQPTALALNESANVVLVLDASSKRVTEIDSVSNTVVTSYTAPVAGTPTGISVNPSGASIVVTTGTSSSSAGTVAVIDTTTKQVQSVRDFTIAPDAMVFAPDGTRAAIVAKDVTTLVDASYKTLATMPGGVGAAFLQTGDNIAILSSGASDSVVTYIGRNAPGSLHLAGSPRAIAALPDGGVLVLVDLGGKSRVSFLSSDGHEVGNVDLAIAGRDIVYDAATQRFSVSSAGQVVSASVPQVIAAASPTPASTSANATPNTSPAGSPSAQPSSSPAPSGSPAPSPSGASSPTPNPLALASPTAPNFVHVDLPGGRQPILVSKSNELLWVLDDHNGVDTVDMITGDTFQIAALPRGAEISYWSAGRDYVYAVDARSGQLHVIARGKTFAASYTMNFLKPVSSIAVGLDDHLWIALNGAPYLLSFDPTTAKMASFNLAGARVSKITVDAVGRILYADDGRGTVGIYDAARSRVSEVPVAHHGATTALVLDSSGTLWLATSTGEIYGVRDNVATLAIGLQRPVTTLSVDVSGRAWYLAPLPSGSVGFGYATADGLGAGLTVDGPASSLDFNALGRAWLADPRGGFYVSQDANR